MYFLRQLKKFLLPAKMLVNFYTTIIESILTSSITVWFAAATARDKAKLQRVIHSAETVIGYSLLSLQELYISRSQRRAAKIAADPSHPGNELLQSLPSGKRLWSIRTRTLRHKNSFFPTASDCAVTSYTYGFTPNYNCANNRTFYCYRFLILVKEKKTWEEAQEFCRTNYTGLVSVTYESSLRQLINGMVETETESVWTGLHFVNGKWLWVSRDQLGSLVSMPSCPAQSYSCGALNTMTNTLKNHNCNERLNFVCYWK
ncbi:hypothetical protein QTP86_006063 [Hemibagrus guttatus]|nr:hypothetical protein QTP86_006063 [Hemibagrus guttatus]